MLPCWSLSVRGRGDGVLQCVEQVGRAVGVHVGEVGEPLVVLTDPRHQRVDVGQDRVAVLDGLAEPLAQPVERLCGGGQRLVELDRVHLLRDRHDGLEQRVELRGHAPTRRSRRPTKYVAATGSFGEENATYLLPNTVLALIAASTFFGIRWTNCRLTSRTTLAFCSSPTLTASMVGHPADLDAVVGDLRTRDPSTGRSATRSA